MPLTNREYEILAELSKGKLYKEMGGELHLSINTIKKHIKNIYRKLQVRNRTEAFLTYMEETNKIENTV